MSDHPDYWDFKPFWRHQSIDKTRCRHSVYQGRSPVASQCSRQAVEFCIHGVGYCTQHARARQTCQERP